MAETEVRTKLRQPAGAPHPVGEDWIHEHRHEKAEDNERGELPALGHRASGDRARGIHEHHLEEEQREHSDVVAVAAEEKSFEAEQPERMTKERDRGFMIERRCAAERAN